MANFVFANNIKATVASAFSNVATSLTLASSVGLPTLSAGQVLPITINDAATGLVYEICYATAITGATLTVTRAQEGTAAQNWLVGDRAYCAPTALSVAPVSQFASLFFSSGTRMSFNQTSAPTSWTKDTTINDSIMRIVSGTVGNGGSQAFSTWNGLTSTEAHTLAVSEIPTGLVSLTDPGHQHTVPFTWQPSGAAGGATPIVGASSALATSVATTGTYLTEHGGNGSHTHPLTNNLLYNDFIIAVKN